MSWLKKFIRNYMISDGLTLESRTLNFVCFFGAIAGVAAVASRFVAGMEIISAAPLFLMIAAIVAILGISVKSTRYTALLTNVIVCGVSIIFWPILFFTVGGPESGMAAYFTLAIILDFTLLKGKTRVFAAIMTCTVMVLCYASVFFMGMNAF